MSEPYSAKMFTKSPNVFTMARVSEKKTLLLLSTSGNAAYSKEFDEAECAKLSSSMDWSNFHDNIHSAFLENKCSTNVGSSCCELNVPNVGSFSLPKQTKDVTGDTLMLSNIVPFVRLRTAKDPEKLVREVAEREAKMSKRAEEMQAEVRAAQQELVDFEENEEKEGTLAQLKKVEGEIKRQDKPRRHTEKTKELDEDLSCLARNPLGNQTCYELDVELLKLIKTDLWRRKPTLGSEMSTTQPDADAQSYASARDHDRYNPDPLAPHMNVVPLYSPGQFEGLKQNIPKAAHAAVIECLQRLDEWDFDVFKVQSAMTGSYAHDGLVSQPHGGSLFIVAYSIIVKHGLLHKYNLDEKILLNWLSVVEAGYHPNPYHNSMHAADVLHVTNYILQAGGLAAVARLTDEDIFAAIFSAAIHDYNHPGINNNFHVKAQTYLSVLFNDKSVLENVHVSCMFELMKLECFDILSCFDEEQKRLLKDTIVEMVLATDMGLHAKILSSFKRRLGEDKNFVKRDDVKLALSIALKMADISNCGRNESLYLRWCDQISDEFYLQGDRERNLGQAVLPFMDRYSTNVAKGQIAFMNYIAIPLFECVSDYLPLMHFTVDFCESNKTYWSSNGS